MLKQSGCGRKQFGCGVESFAAAFEPLRQPLPPPTDVSQSVFTLSELDFPSAARSSRLRNVQVFATRR
jgi:hypothetical protein